MKRARGHAGLWILFAFAWSGCSGSSTPLPAPSSPVTASLRQTQEAESLPDWVLSPSTFPDGLKGTNNCSFPMVPNTTTVWNQHEDGGCWEHPGPDGWTRQHLNAVHVEELTGCGRQPGDVTTIRVCRAGGEGQVSPCYGSVTGPRGCAVCIDPTFTCH